MSINRQNYDSCQYGTPSLNISPVPKEGIEIKASASKLSTYGNGFVCASAEGDVGLDVFLCENVHITEY